MDTNTLVAKETEMALLMESVKQLQSLVIGLTQEFKEMRLEVAQIDKTVDVRLDVLKQQLDDQVNFLKEQNHTQDLTIATLQTRVNIAIAILTMIGSAVVISMLGLTINRVFHETKKAEIGAQPEQTIPRASALN